MVTMSKILLGGSCLATLAEAATTGNGAQSKNLLSSTAKSKMETTIDGHHDAAIQELITTFRVPEAAKDSLTSCPVLTYYSGDHALFEGSEKLVTFQQWAEKMPVYKSGTANMSAFNQYWKDSDVPELAMTIEDGGFQIHTMLESLLQHQNLFANVQKRQACLNECMLYFRNTIVFAHLPAEGNIYEHARGYYARSIKHWRGYVVAKEAMTTDEASTDGGIGDNYLPLTA